MRKIKKLTAFILAASMALSMAGCGKTGEDATTESTTEVAATEEAPVDVAEEDQDGNLIENGNFDKGVLGFSLYLNGGVAEMATNEDGELQIDIEETGKVEHGVQVYHDGFEMRQGVVYRFSFDTHCTIERDYDWRIQINGGDYHAYRVDTVKGNPDVQHISVDFTMQEASDPAPRLCFNLGCVNTMQQAGIDPTSIEPHSIMIDNIELIIIDDKNAAAAVEAVEGPKVKINQIGYKKAAKKIATVSDMDESKFSVVDAESGDTVFEGDLGDAVTDEGAGETIKKGDFSDLNKEGTYKIVCGGEESFTFKIGDDVYDAPFESVINMFYLQRCGMELGDEAGDFAHPECHTGEATIYGTSDKIDVTGGWHDAGDYGRYVVPGAKAAADLMLAYQLYNTNKSLTGNDKFLDKDGNGVSDVLDEVKYELDWMLKMQAPNGGVYHKVSCKMFPETVMPEEETDDLIVCPISKTATADFAAVMAMAGELFGECGQGEYKEYGNTCLEAAKKAYDYFEEIKNSTSFKNPTDIVTGEYPDNNSSDENFWAAAQLYKATGDDKYKDAMTELIDASKVKNFGNLGWASVGGYGSYAVLTTDELMASSDNLYDTVKGSFFEEVNKTVDICKKNGYMAGRDTEYEWGSNMGIANVGMLLCMANEIDPSEDYTNYAFAQLNYLLGVNATGYCFVTGEGTLTPENPHHRPSQAKEKCMPGMLVGGPDSALEDSFAKAVLADLPPAKCYADSDQSFSCNEITIYWNSPLVYLMTATVE